MKKLLLTFVCAAAALGVCAAPEKIGFDKLPKSSQEFIQKNFPREVVKDTEMDRRRGTSTPSISTAAPAYRSKAARETGRRS